MFKREVYITLMYFCLFYSIISSIVILLKSNYINIKFDFDW